MTEECKAIVDYLGCDYELIQNVGNNGCVMERFRALTEQGAHNGFFPLIIVPSDVLAEALEIACEDAESPAALRAAALQAAQNTTAQAVFARQLEENEHDPEDILGEFDESSEPDGEDGAYMGEPELLIVKIPAAHPWELAAWVPMGGFNDCPSPAEQVAVFRYWYETYGAVPRLVTYDIWEMQVAKPPSTNEQAEALAKEQYAFCYDIVEQGTETIRALASGLLNCNYWYFWWD